MAQRVNGRPRLFQNKQLAALIDSPPCLHFSEVRKTQTKPADKNPLYGVTCDRKLGRSRQGGKERSCAHSLDPWDQKPIINQSLTSPCEPACLEPKYLWETEETPAGRQPRFYPFGRVSPLGGAGASVVRLHFPASVCKRSFSFQGDFTSIYLIGVLYTFFEVRGSEGMLRKLREGLRKGAASFCTVRHERGKKRNL